MREVTREWRQKPDDMSDSELDQRLRIELVDAGAGDYPVLSTERWAFDTGDDLRKLATIVDEMMTQKGKR